MSDRVQTLLLRVRDLLAASPWLAGVPVRAALAALLLRRAGDAR